MRHKKVKRVIGSICAAAVLFTSIPASQIVASATEETTPKNTGVEFYNASGTKLENAEHSLHGVEYVHDDITDQGLYVRMPEENARTISEEITFTENAKAPTPKEPSLFNTEGDWFNTVYSLSRESAGGRLRFNTNSKTIKIEAKLYLHDFAHYEHGKSMEAAKYGFDVYVDTVEGSTYAGTVQGTPEVVYDVNDIDEDGNTDEIIDIASNIVDANGTITFDAAESRDITIYFPITIETNSVKITVDNDSEVKQHVKGYEGEGQIVFYGSSITQGGAVTKPGNTYVNTVGRNLNRDYIDLGMWGRCKGETTFAEYIANLGDVSAFVLDYDHNNSTVAAFTRNDVNTHYNFYQTVRKAYPDIPIIIMTRPGSGLDISIAEGKNYSTAAEMKAFIRETYETAVANGDENVHFVDGESFFGYSKAYMADDSHPNDAGQAKMAEVVTAVFEQIYAGKKNLCVAPNDCSEELLLNEGFEEATEGTTEPEGWKKNAASNITDDTSKVITETEGNKAYQMQFTRVSGGSTMGLYPTDTLWSEGTNSAVEMDVELYKQCVDTATYFPYIGVRIGESSCNNACQKYEIRFRPFTQDYRVYMYDGTDENDTNPSASLAYNKIEDESFVDMYANQDKITFHLRIETEYVTSDGSINVAVLVNGTHVAGFNFQPQDGFVPERFLVNCYGTTNGVSNKVVVDNIKVYSFEPHTISYESEVAATETAFGTEAHYVCGECGGKFWDREGIVRAAECDLMIVPDCVEVLFMDDYENGDHWSSTSNYSGTGTQGITSKGSNSLYQLLVTRESGSTNSYMRQVIPELSEYNNYTIDMETTLYRGSLSDGTSAGNKWPMITIMLYDTETSGYYDIRISPTSAGLKTYVREKTLVAQTNGKNYIDTETRAVTNENFAVSSSLTEINYDIHLGYNKYVDSNGEAQLQLSLCVENGEHSVVELFDITPSIEDCVPNQLRMYVYPSTINETTHFKAEIDNVRIHVKHTPEYVALDETTDVKAHYECSVCGKKFTDATCKTEATEEWLAYNTQKSIQLQLDDTGEKIRFVVYIDDYNNYKKVEFTITCSQGTGTAPCTDVYEGIIAGGQKLQTEDVYGVDGYFATFILAGNTEDDLKDDMMITATWTLSSGETVTETRLVNIDKERPSPV